MDSYQKRRYNLYVQCAEIKPVYFCDVPPYKLYIQ